MRVLNPLMSGAAMIPAVISAAYDWDVDGTKKRACGEER